MYSIPGPSRTETHKSGMGTHKGCGCEATLRVYGNVHGMHVQMSAVCKRIKRQRQYFFLTPDNRVQHTHKKLMLSFFALT